MKVFLVPNLGIFVSSQNFANNSFLKFQSKNTQIRHFCWKVLKLGIFGPNFKDFYFAPNFAIRQIWGRWFQIWQWLFRIARKYPNKAFFVLNVSMFYFCMKLRILKNSRVLITEMARCCYSPIFSNRRWGIIFYIR